MHPPPQSALARGDRDDDVDGCCCKTEAALAAPSLSFSSSPSNESRRQIAKRWTVAECDAAPSQTDASRISSLDHSPARVPLATTTPNLALLSCPSLAGSMTPVLVPVAAPLPATPGGVSTSKAIRFRVPSTMYGSQPVISSGSCHWANSSRGSLLPRTEGLLTDNTTRADEKNNRARCPPPAARCNSQLATRNSSSDVPSVLNPAWRAPILSSPLAYHPSRPTRKPTTSKKGPKGPNFSPPSITLSDVGPDPGLPSTRQDKPTMHLVFCGCRVPDPRPPSPSPSPSSAPSPSPSLLSLPSHARQPCLDCAGLDYEREEEEEEEEEAKEKRERVVSVLLRDVCPRSSAKPRGAIRQDTGTKEPLPATARLPIHLRHPASSSPPAFLTSLARSLFLRRDSQWTWSDLHPTIRRRFSVVVQPEPGHPNQPFLAFLRADRNERIRSESLYSLPPSLTLHSAKG
ncbi:hypothetical protein CH63R_03020 [Colletotrichum higginsianum IMI 349063]|uniref:Uncharacterized protein n=1 Tax=Colletotrichum higginsianum (strain IMI 349063) TaxID=759273 RepID=A0A1B7YQQ9_COLHI|nr:hypothetical protein CH63R_03020 [Colletotrichum higginsianum IMI 349063]OBR14294.1 hypothetical protein CH63R_03020 [Colletotrichum higginsianum IMI 349063]